MKSILNYLRDGKKHKKCTVQKEKKSFRKVLENMKPKKNLQLIIYCSVRNNVE